LCGRGKDAYDNIGNRRLRLLVAANLEEYVMGNRTCKTQIIRNLVDQILEADGRFIKKDEDELCCEIGLFYAREKVGHIFRDCVRQAERNNSRAKSLGAKVRGLHATQDSIFRGMNIKATFKSTPSVDEKGAKKNAPRDDAAQPDRPLS
jgi:hypothetical protein